MIFYVFLFIILIFRFVRVKMLSDVVMMLVRFLGFFKLFFFLRKVLNLLMLSFFLRILWVFFKMSFVFFFLVFLIMSVFFLFVRSLRKVLMVVFFRGYFFMSWNNFLVVEYVSL